MVGLMKYAIDAHYGDVINAITSICESGYQEWESEGSYGECKYEEIEEYPKSWGEMGNLCSSVNRYFNFEGFIFKINKTQPLFGCTVIEELDFLDAQWHLGESKDITWIMDRVCQVLNKVHAHRSVLGSFEYFTNHTDDFYALQEKYEIYIPPHLTS